MMALVLLLIILGLWWGFHSINRKLTKLAEMVADSCHLSLDIKRLAQEMEEQGEDWTAEQSNWIALLKAERGRIREAKDIHI